MTAVSERLRRVWRAVFSDVDITERRQAERELQQRTAELRESDQRVRRKLDCIVSPEGDLRDLELADVLDVSTIELLLQDFQAVVHLPTALVDLRGKIHAGVNWQSICTRFHCNNPGNCNKCVVCGTRLCAGIAEGEFKA